MKTKILVFTLWTCSFLLFFSAAAQTVIMYDPAKDIPMNQNPAGPWEMGYGSGDDDFIRFDKWDNRGTGGYWNGNESWKGFYMNPGNDVMLMSKGFLVTTGMFVMHPGNRRDHLSKLKFTAPESGSYEVKVKWTAIDNAARKISVAVLAPVHRTGSPAPSFERQFSQNLSGYRSTAEFSGVFTLAAGHSIVFQVGNGGDQYFDDALQLELAIKKQP